MFRTITSAAASAAEADDVCRQLLVDPRLGLSPTDVAERRKYHGANELTTDDEDPLWKKFLEKFKEPMIALLLASAGVSLVMRQFDDALSIALVRASWLPGEAAAVAPAVRHCFRRRRARAEPAMCAGSVTLLVDVSLSSALRHHSAAGRSRVALPCGRFRRRDRPDYCRAASSPATIARPPARSCLGAHRP
jgi:hypothetical protein